MYLNPPGVCSLVLPTKKSSTSSSTFLTTTPPVIMSKRTFYTNITPLPSQITRQLAVGELHDHGVMIKLNPLVIHFERSTAHKDAPSDEYHCTWYEITDKVSYLPGVSSQVKYKACFFDRPVGIQTHCYAPAGLDIKAKWSVGGNMPGEPREARELGVDTPRDGLYLREEVDMRCNIMLTSFVKKNLKNAHKVLVDRLLKKVEFTEETHYQRAMTSASVTGSPSFPMPPGAHPNQYLPQRSDGSVVAEGMYPPGGRPPSASPSLQQQQLYLQQQQYPQNYQYNSYPHPETDPHRFSGPPPQYWQHPDQKGDPNMQYQKMPPPMPGYNPQLYGPPRPVSGNTFTAELPGSDVRPVDSYSRPPSSVMVSPRPPSTVMTGSRPPSTVISSPGLGPTPVPNAVPGMTMQPVVEMEGTQPPASEQR